MRPRIYSTPLLAPDGRMFVATSFDLTIASGVVYEIKNLHTNKATVGWEYRTGDVIEASPVLHPNGTIIFGSFDGVVHGVDAANGRRRWQRDLAPLTDDVAFVAATGALSPSGDTVYVVVGTFGSDVSYGRSLLVALSCADGAVRWTLPLPGHVEAAPVVTAEGDVVVATKAGQVMKYDAEGRLRWQRDVRGAVWDSPAIGRNGTLYVSALGGTFHALGADGRVRWTFDISAPSSPIVGPDDTIYVTNFSDGRLHALRPDDEIAERSKWSAFCAPAYGVSPCLRRDGTLLLAGGDEQLRCFNSVTGALVWSSSYNGEATGTVAVSPVDGQLYVAVVAKDVGGTVEAFTGNGVGLSRLAAWPTLHGDGTHTGRAVTTSGDALLLNLSARGTASDTEPLICGFVSGAASFGEVVLRAAGPALRAFDIGRVAEDPELEVKLPQFDGFTLRRNDDWEASEVLLGAMQRVAAFPFSENSKDAALIASVPGHFATCTAVIRNQVPAAGVVLGEVYDASASLAAASLVNLSARGWVRSGEEVLIVGFVIEGTGRSRVLLRGVGPGLAAHQVTQPLAAPILRVFDGASREIARNSGWSSAEADGDFSAIFSSVGAFPLSSGARDCALLMDLAPGQYTVIVSSGDGAGGVALAEIYSVRTGQKS